MKLTMRRAAFTNNQAVYEMLRPGKIIGVEHGSGP
jgi:hypothetical protein